MRCLLIIFLLLSVQGAAQEIPEGFSKLVKLNRPHSKRNSPTDFMFDNSRSRFAVSIGYKPAQIYVFETSSLKLLQIFKLKSFVYFSTSYFGTTSNGNIYLDNGRNKTRYHACNVETGEVKKVDCSETPLGCEYYQERKVRMEFNRYENSVYVYGPDFLIITEAESYTIYVRDN